MENITGVCITYFSLSRFPVSVKCACLYLNFSIPGDRDRDRKIGHEILTQHVDISTCRVVFVDTDRVGFLGLSRGFSVLVQCYLYIFSILTWLP